jgi:hypothetical protein
MASLRTRALRQERTVTRSAVLEVADMVNPQAGSHMPAHLGEPATRARRTCGVCHDLPSASTGTLPQRG